MRSRVESSARLCLVSAIWVVVCALLVLASPRGGRGAGAAAQGAAPRPQQPIFPGTGREINFYALVQYGNMNNKLLYGTLYL